MGGTSYLLAFFCPEAGPLKATSKLTPARVLILLASVSLLTACGQDEAPGESDEWGGHAPEIVFGSPQIAVFDEVDGYGVSPIVQAPEGATRVGFLIDTWEDPVDVDALIIEARGLDGAFEGPWVRAEIVWSGHPTSSARSSWETCTPPRSSAWAPTPRKRWPI